MYIYISYVYYWYHHVLHKRQGWGNTCIEIFGLFAVFFFFKKIVVMYLYSIFVLCVIKGRAEMMTFALKLLHKERLNLPCFRHSTSFNRCLSLESRTVSYNIYISTPPYQVVDYMIPFYPDPFGLFVNMEVGSTETQKRRRTNWCHDF